MMTLGELKAVLSGSGDAHVRFRLPSGAPVAAHAHVTEVARVDKRFIDCGGTFRRESWCRLQTWVADDVGHRLTAGRLLGALVKAAPTLDADADGLGVDVEHEDGVVSQYPLLKVAAEPGAVVLELGQRHTDCLAKELCVPAPVQAAPITFGRRPAAVVSAPAPAPVGVPTPVTELPLVLVLCTGNSCRSHLAEGFLRAASQGRFRVASAGSRPAGYVHPLAIRAMAEVGIDISGHSSKHLDEFLRERVETVITVCGNADQACPTFPGQVRRLHWPFDDPAHATGTDEEKMAVFRRVRDEIARVFGAYAAGRLA